MIDLLIVGPTGGTHIAGSLVRAAAELGLNAHVEDTAPAYNGQPFARALMWRLGGRKPYRLNEFSSRVRGILERGGVRRLLCIGQSPLTAEVLQAARTRGVTCLAFSTDDPWNPAQRASWYLRSLVHYDRIFTPRRANMEDFRSIGCRDVRYLPFGYDPALFAPTAGIADDEHAAEVLFVGGADSDRVQFIEDFIAAGGRPLLAGGYWDRHPKLRSRALGLKSPAELSRLTAGASVNLCLVRRANRDGHVMRSFEIPALGGFLLAEDTAEHRAIFGEEGSAALYFGSAREAAEKSRWAIGHPLERKAMARAAHKLVTMGRHTYKDRLVDMLEPVAA